VTPQIYWERGKVVADYTILADWWSKNTFGAQLYIGQAPYRIDPKAKDIPWHTADEIIGQIALNRKYRNIGGSMFFSAKFMRSNPLGLQKKLLAKYYRFPALTPINPRIDGLEPQKPSNAQIKVEKGKMQFSWSKTEDTKSFVIYQFKKRQSKNINKPEHIFLTTADNSFTQSLNNASDPAKYKYVVTAISKTNIESKPVTFTLKK